MRWLLTLLVLLPSLALAQFPISRGGTVRSGPRILGEPAEPITPPVGFGWDPGLMIENQGGSYIANVDVSQFAPTGKTYYVGHPGASDSNDGLTSGTALASMAAAVGKADAVVIRVYPKLYHRNQGIFTINTARSISIIGDGGVALLSAHEPGMVWTLDSDATYRATRSAVESVWDSSITDERGDYQRLVKRANLAEAKAAPGSWFTDGTEVWVHTSDGRPPDAQVLVYLQVGSSISGAATVYLENLRFEGGRPPLRIFNGGSGATMPTVYGKNVAFKYSALNGLEVLGAFTHLQGCEAARNGLDGLNYHVHNAVLCRSIEVNCVGRDNGWSGGDIHNGSSTHDGQSIVRIGGRYERNSGPNVADVNGSKAWNVGVVAASSTAAGGQNVNFWLDGEMWCDGCVSSGSTTDLRVQLTGSKAHLRNSILPIRSVDAGATVDAY